MDHFFFFICLECRRPEFGLHVTYGA